jgi:hypothetical protein
MRHTFAYFSLRAGVPISDLAPRDGPHGREPHVPQLRPVVQRAGRASRQHPYRLGEHPGQWYHRGTRHARSPVVEPVIGTRWGYLSSAAG